MEDKWIQRTSDEYAQGWNRLLPRGAAWPRAKDSVLQKVVGGLSQIWGDKVEEYAAALLTRECDPRETIDLLPDWERNFGLPDTCVDEPLTIEARHAALLQRMTMLGRQDRQFFIDVALELGYVVTITEYRPFMVGIDRCGDNRPVIGAGVYGDPPAEIGPPEIRFYWTVHVGAVRLSWFRCDSGQCGIDPLLTIALATDLECILRRFKPAHTMILFDYSGLAGVTTPRTFYFLGF